MLISGEQKERGYVESALGLIIAVTMKWIYFDIEFEEHTEHAVRRSPYTALLWIHTHLLLLISITIASVGVANLVVFFTLPVSTL